MGWVGRVGRVLRCEVGAGQVGRVLRCLVGAVWVLIWGWESDKM